MWGNSETDNCGRTTCTGQVDYLGTDYSGTACPMERDCESELSKLK